MGDPKFPIDDATSSSLPPGSRFYPSEQQLICYYLASKNNDSNNEGAAANSSDWRSVVDVIGEIDLYSFDPFNLPEESCFRFGSGGRRRHWYCYVGAAVRERGGRRRRAGGGYWKRRRTVRNVVGGAGAGKVKVGTRESFVFYLGDSPRNAVRTHWVMYEYALIDHDNHHAGSFVLCRVFYKSQIQNCLSENIFSSCGEGSVATVRHVGVQCDGVVRSAVGESRTQEKISHDDDNEVMNSVGLGTELDGSIRSKLISKQDLIAILDEDFIELDDLLYPLPGID